MNRFSSVNVAKMDGTLFTKHIFWRLVALLWFIGAAYGCGERESPGAQRESGVAQRNQMPAAPTISADPNHSDGCGSSRVEPGAHSLTLKNEGRNRNYIMTVPESARRNSVAHPLLVAMHGFGGNGASMRYLLNQGKTFEHEYVVLYPDGAGSTNSMRGWNSGHPECCGTALKENIDDVGLIREMVESVAKDVCVDLDRVYATGFSNGGDMAQRLACDASDLVAAVTSVAGRFDYHARACPGLRPVPTVLYRGKQDRTVPYENNVLSLLAIQTIPAMEGFNQIAINHGCEGNPIYSLSMDNADCLQADLCVPGTELTLCTISDAGHCWPGLGNCSGTGQKGAREISASGHMQIFFSRQSISQ